MKNNRKAIISCGVLYREVNRLSNESSWDIEFLPQGLHDRPDSSFMKHQIQDKIDELEKEADYDQIVLGYGFCGGGVEGLSTDRAELVVQKNTILETCTSPLHETRKFNLPSLL